MTVEELEILVDASIEPALNELKKLMPQIRKQMNEIKKEFNDLNLKEISAKVDMKAVEKELKNAKKKIKEVFDPNDTSGMTINGKPFEIKNIKGYSSEAMRLKGYIENIRKSEEKIGDIKPPKAIDDYKQKLNELYEQWGQGKISLEDIEKFKANNNPENQNREVNEIQPSQNSLSIWDILKQKIQQIRPEIEQYKQSLNSGNSNKELELVKYKISEIEEKLEKAKNGEIHLDTKQIIEAEAELERLNSKKERIEKDGSGNIFSNWLSGLSKTTPKLSGISSITIRIKNQIKQMGSSFAGGLKHVLKYAGALLSIRGIYGLLRNSASAWLSSQNAGAQQLSANIDYMKYAMGSALSPVIEYIVSLVYTLMKGIQQVAYALTGVNIFAKATASSMKSTANNTKQATKEAKALAGVHSEINNISSNDNNSGGGSGSASPSFDLSSMDNTTNSLIDAIKNGNWYGVGAELGRKLNEAMSNIPWDKIKEGARNLAKGLADFLNGFIKKTDWTLVGETLAEGINTAIEFLYTFITTFDWVEFGKAMGKAVNGFINKIDWKKAGKTLGEGIKGIFNSLASFLEEVDWASVVKNIETYIASIDWAGVAKAIFKAIGAAIGGLGSMAVQLLFDAATGINEAIDKNIEECGGNVMKGLLKGMLDNFVQPAKWIYDNIFIPFIEGFKKAFGIHSPSKVMEQQGNFIIEGLKNGISGIWDKVKEIFTTLYNNIKDKFTSIKNKAVEIFNTMKDNVKGKIDTLKTNITTIVTTIYTKIKDKFTSAKDKAVSIFNSMKTKVKSIFDGIWTNIKKVINSILGGIEKMANGVVKGINTVIKAMNKLKFKIPDWVPGGMGGKSFGFNIGTIGEIKIPKLATGNVAYKPMLAQFGEYSGARTNPEITTPQNIMRETFEDVMSDFTSNMNNNPNGQVKQLVIQFGSQRVALEMDNLIRQARRQNGTAYATI